MVEWGMLQEGGNSAEGDAEDDGGARAPQKVSLFPVLSLVDMTLGPKQKMVYRWPVDHQQRVESIDLAICPEWWSTNVRLMDYHCNADILCLFFLKKKWSYKNHKKRTEIMKYRDKRANENYL